VPGPWRGAKWEGCQGEFRGCLAAPTAHGPRPTAHGPSWGGVALTCTALGSPRAQDTAGVLRLVHVSVPRRCARPRRWGRRPGPRAWPRPCPGARARNTVARLVHREEALQDAGARGLEVPARPTRHTAVAALGDAESCLLPLADIRRDLPTHASDFKGFQAQGPEEGGNPGLRVRARAACQ